jgi:hypothetical protein
MHVTGRMVNVAGAVPGEGAQATLMHRGQRDSVTTQTLILLLLLVVCWQGCATMRMALAPRERGAPPWPPPAADQAQFYLFCAPGTPSTVLTAMRLDGEPLDVEPTATARLLGVTPGPHVLTAGPAEDREALTVVARAGQTYVVRVSSRGGGLRGGVLLEVFDEEAGRDALDAARAQGLVHP